MSAVMPTSVLENATAVSQNMPQNGREARNLAEKHRRDKLNASIQELATMVPHVADSTRRMDKTAVLRFAAHGLRLNYVFGKTAAVRENEKITEVSNSLQPELTDTLMQLFDSFFLTLTCHGTIVLISSSVEQLLGHCQSDLYGQNILGMVHPEDQALLLQQLIPRNMDALFQNEDDATLADQLDEGIMADELEEDEEYDFSPTLHSLRYGKQQRRRLHSNQNADIDKNLREDRRCFTIRIARAGTRSETSRKYELVMIDGLFRRSDCSATAGIPIVSQLIRRSRNNNNNSGNSSNTQQHLMQHDVAIAQAALHGISGNDIVLVAMARVIRPPKFIGRLLESNNLEYRTRHLIDGRIIDCDQRIGLVAGYMKDEVRNLCPFTFMHQDDVRWVIVALRQMYDCNSNYGESCYRLLSRNGHFIYLQTKGYLEIDKSTNKVHSFVCINTLLDEEEGRHKVQEMKKKFSIIIKAKIPNSSIEDVPASQNPQQLERIVLYLIENLQKRHNDSFVTPTAEPTTPRKQKHLTTLTNTDDNIPLALVPPETDSVKSSISKSVNVVNVTAARNLQYNLRSPASYQSSDISLSPASSIDHSDDFYGENNTNMDITSSSPLPMTTTATTSMPLPMPMSIPLQQTQQQLQPQRPSVLVQPKKSPQLPTLNTVNDANIQKSKISNCIINGKNGKCQNNLQKLQNVSTLKRTQSPTNCFGEDNISPAKRTPAANLGVLKNRTVIANVRQSLCNDPIKTSMLLNNVRKSNIFGNVKMECIDETQS